jgi:hypothetical protein
MYGCRGAPEQPWHVREATRRAWSNTQIVGVCALAMHMHDEIVYGEVMCGEGVLARGFGELRSGEIRSGRKTVTRSKKVVSRVRVNVGVLGVLVSPSP